MARKEDLNATHDKARGKEPGLSVIAVGMSINGRLDTNGVVKVEGKVTGSVRAERQVLVAKGGMVDGDILTREAVIGGEVRGAIFADERVEVQATSQINGDITTRRILLQEGGEVNGHVRMEDPKALSRKPRSQEAAGSDSKDDKPRVETDHSGSTKQPKTSMGPTRQPPVGQGISNP